MELADWWMDTWVSRVYGAHRTTLVEHVLVGHRTKEHGRRYTVNHKNKEALEPLVQIGKSQIAAYMRRQNMNLSVMSSFLGDRFDGSAADLQKIDVEHAKKKSRSC